MDLFHPPIEAAMRFVVIDDEHGVLSILSRNPGEVTLSIIHETIAGEVIASDLLGLVASPRIEVATGEALILLARIAGRLIASQVYEVECAAAAHHYGFILRPAGGYNLLLTQEETRRASHLYQVDQVDVSAPDDERARYQQKSEETAC